MTAVVKPILTNHARRRRKQMNVTEDQIAAAIADPETVYPGNPATWTRATCYQRGRIVVVVADGSGVVVTILWHRAEGRNEQGGPL